MPLCLPQFYAKSSERDGATIISVAHIIRSYKRIAGRERITLAAGIVCAPSLSFNSTLQLVIIRSYRRLNREKSRLTFRLSSTSHTQSLLQLIIRHFSLAARTAVPETSLSSINDVAGWTML